jgi:hypothetical protein
MFVLGACGGGGSSATQFGNCGTEGETFQGSDGLPLICVMNSAGELMWDVDPNGQLVAGEDGSIAYPTLSSIFSSDCDKEGATSYTAGIGNASQWSHVVPLGAMVTTHVIPVDHIYVFYPLGSEGSEMGTYSVTVPADGTIVRVEDFRKSNDYPYPDYRVVIEHSCDLYSVFIHVGELQGVAAEAAKGAADDGEWQGRIAVEAGEVLADDSTVPGYDFSTFATSAKADLINPASFLQFEAWRPYTANPLEYFPADIRAEYELKSLRNVEPVGGDLFTDVRDTAQGTWFVKDTNGNRGLGTEKASYNNREKVARGHWDTHLAFAPDNVDPKSFIYSIGDWEGCPCQFMSVGNVDPSTITAGGAPTVVDLVEYSYLAPDGSPMEPNRPVKGYTLKPGTAIVGSIAFQVNSDGTMTVEKRPGKDAASFAGFGADALTYVR